MSMDRRPPSSSSSSSIDIYLVRHAESCSNLLDNKITDTIPDTDTDTDNDNDNDKWNKYNRIIKNTEIKNYTDETIASINRRIKTKEKELEELKKKVITTDTTANTITAETNHEKDELIKEAKILGIKGSHLFGLQKLKDEIEKAKKEQETK